VRDGGGIQREVVVSLAVLMASATGLLMGLFLWAQGIQSERLQPLLARALHDEANGPVFRMGGVSPGIDWWIVSESGHFSEVSAMAGPIDADSLALALEVRGRAPVMKRGMPWQPVRFAVRRRDGSAAVARIPPILPLAALTALLVADALVFGIFGSYLLRGRVVGPMRELSAAVRSMGEGGAGARVQVEGVREVRNLAVAFNEMSEALEQRTGALEKAVGDLRQTNYQLVQARAGLDRAERLAAVGSLAAGVAHEVGNPMGALLAFLQLVEGESGLSEQGRAHLGRASEQGARVREILRQLLDFSRPPQARTDWVEVQHVASQVESLVRAQRRYDHIAFELEQEPGVVPVLSDESMLSQLLLNLVLNAAAAVGDRPDARVSVMLRPGRLRVRAGESRDAPPNPRKRADAVECEVADNGPGVAMEDRERIFDPFFTTKPPGEGTGLGLANAQRLAQEIGGSLEYEDSERLGGAAFVLRLPIGGGEPDTEARRDGSEQASPGSRTP
jgi:two-component system NtrC family sensor kinase